MVGVRLCASVRVESSLRVVALMSLQVRNGVESDDSELMEETFGFFASIAEISPEAIASRMHDIVDLLLEAIESVL